MVEKTNNIAQEGFPSFGWDESQREMSLKLCGLHGTAKTQSNTRKTLNTNASSDELARSQLEDQASMPSLDLGQWRPTSDKNRGTDGTTLPETRSLDWDVLSLCHNRNHETHSTHKLDSAKNSSGG